MSDQTGIHEAKFVLSAQKIVDLQTNTLQACEIFTQLKKTTDKNPASARGIIDQANASKETASIDFFALNCLGSVCEKLDTDTFFINLSPYTLCAKENLDELRDKLQALVQMGKQVAVEINNPPKELNSQEYIQMYSNAMKLARNGVKFATNPYYRAADVSVHLDKQHTPFLKIARPLLHKAMESEQTCTALERDIRIAKIQGRKIIGEGVETEQELAHCKKLDCDWIQGYLISRPAQLFTKGLSLDDVLI
jgi:EAL domain-containing protein (putative c-di-GMP-specific phosphodiesterase class I)